MKKQKLAGILSVKSTLVASLALVAGMFALLLAFPPDSVSASNHWPRATDCGRMQNGQFVANTQWQGSSPPAYYCNYVDSNGNEVRASQQASSGGQCSIFVVGQQVENVTCIPEYGGRASTNSPPPAIDENDSGGSGGSGEGGEAPEPECVAGGFGWFICAAIEAIHNVVSFMYERIVEPLSKISPIPLDTSSAMFRTWSNILTVANIIFAIMFMFIIFSQATSVGISNYGIKRMLPRLIVAAILMNLSYYICAIMVDLSNLAGSGIRDLMFGVSEGAAFGGGGGVLQSIVAGTLTAVGITIFVFVAASTLALALAVVYLVLAIRWALIVILTLVSPLAFVAWLLPNTERYFKKWWELFVGLLVVYPALMAVFAGATVAANTLANSGGGDEDTQISLLIAALLIQAAPLFAVPFIIKASSSTLGRVQGMTNQYANKSIDAYRNTNYGKYRQGKRAEDARLRATGSYRGSKKNPLTWANAGRSRLNRSLNRSERYNAATRGYGGHRVLDEARQSAEDRDAATKMFSGDFDLAEAWVRGRGSDEYNGLSKAQQDKFAQMERAGFDKKANSYTAAQMLMADAGKGSREDIQAAVSKIDELSPNREQAGITQAELSEYIRSAYRKSGRGDLVVRQGDRGKGVDEGFLTTEETKLDLQGFGPHELGPGGTIKESDVGWNEISMSGLSRHGIGAGTEGRESFKRWTQKSSENERKVVASLDSMEQRARVQAVGALAEAHGIDAKNEVAVADLVDDLRGKHGLRYGGGGGSTSSTAGTTGGSPGSQGGSPSPGTGPTGGNPTPSPGGGNPGGAQGGSPAGGSPSAPTTSGTTLYVHGKPPSPPPPTGGQGGGPTPSPPPPTGSQGGSGQGNQGGGTNQGNQGGNNPPPGSFLG